MDDTGLIVRVSVTSVQVYVTVKSGGKQLVALVPSCVNRRHHQYCRPKLPHSPPFSPFRREEGGLN